jgi:hypothetical protein
LALDAGLKSVAYAAYGDSVIELGFFNEMTMGTLAWSDFLEASSEARLDWTDHDVDDTMLTTPRRNRSLRQLSRESLVARSGDDVDDTIVLTEIPQEAHKLRTQAAKRYTAKQLKPVTYKRCPRKAFQNLGKAKLAGNEEITTCLPGISNLATCMLPDGQDASDVTTEALPPIIFRNSSSGN